ncbi:unnamed protein product [Closterium sp. NIES-65]|nr:unnamed protein product [Closterium sp. NIES-65]
MEELGFGCTDTVEHCKAVLKEHSAGSSISEADVARVMGVVAKGSVETRGGGGGAGPLTFWNVDVLVEAIVQLVSVFSCAGSSISEADVARVMGVVAKGFVETRDGGGGAGPLTFWNVDVLVEAIVQLAPRLSWSSVINHLDYPGFFVKDQKGFSALVLMHSKATKELFPLPSVCSKLWANAEGQLSFLRHAVSAPPEVFTFAHSPRQTPPMDNLHGHKLPTGTPNCAWVSLDLLEALCRIGETGRKAEVVEVLGYPIKHCPEVLIVGLAQVKTPGGGVIQREVLGALVPLYLANNPNSSIVLHALWGVPGGKDVVMQAMVGMHASDPTSIARLLDVCQDLKALSVVLESTPFSFSLDLASLASRREYLNLEKWLQEALTLHRDSLFKACLQFLRAKLVQDSQDASAQRINLSLETLAIFFKVLQANAPQLQAPELGDELKALYASALQLHPALQTVAVPEQAPADVFASDIEEEANAYFQKIYVGQLSIEEVVDMLKRFNGSSVQREQDVFACMIQSLFDEYRFFPRYPDKELRITAVLFGLLFLVERPWKACSVEYRFFLRYPDKELRITAVLFGLLFLVERPWKACSVEYRFFLRYPDKELRITAVLFGSLVKHQLVSSITLGIALRCELGALKKPSGSKMFSFGVQFRQHLTYPPFRTLPFSPHPVPPPPHFLPLPGSLVKHQLVSSITLGIALRCVLDALKKPSDSKMFSFGVTALEQFHQRLPEWPPYCTHILHIPHLQDVHPRLYALVQAAAAAPASKGVAGEGLSGAGGAAAAAGGGGGGAAAGGAGGGAAGAGNVGGNGEGGVVAGAGAGAGGPSAVSGAAAAGAAAGAAGGVSTGGAGGGGGGVDGGGAIGAGDKGKGASGGGDTGGVGPQDKAGKSADGVAGKGAVEGKDGAGGVTQGQAQGQAPGQGQVKAEQKKEEAEEKQGEQQDGAVGGKAEAGSAGQAAVQSPAKDSILFKPSGAALAPIGGSGGSQKLEALRPRGGSGAGVATRAPAAGFGHALNIETLMAAAEKRESPIEMPSSDAQDKVAFIINNIAAANLDQKAKEILEVLKEPFFPWFAQYLVMKRASIEPNFHELYLKFVDKMAAKSLQKEVVKATYENCKVLLRSELIRSSSEERSLLKNIGSWLGRLTIGRNQPLRANQINPKNLIIEAYEKGLMIAIIPFTSKILEPCANSVIYQPPNPWTVGILGLLVEIYSLPNLKLNLKFDIEVLFKNLGIEMKEVKPSQLLVGRQREMEGNPDFSNKDLLAAHLSAAGGAGAGGAGSGRGSPQPLVRSAVASPEPPGPAGRGAMGVPGAGKAEQQSSVLLPNLASYIVISPKLAPVAQQLQLARIVPACMDRAVREIVSPVVERSCSIACMTTRELVLKDFAMEADDSRTQKAANLMVASLAGSLALVTCKEPLRMATANHLRTLLQAALAGAELEQVAQLLTPPPLSFLVRALSSHPSHPTYASHSPAQEPLRVAMANHLRTLLQAALAGAELEQVAQLLVSDNLDLGCAVIEKAASEKLLVSDNLDLGCAVIEKSASEKLLVSGNLDLGCAVIEKSASEKVSSAGVEHVAQLLVSGNLDLGCAVIEKSASEKLLVSGNLDLGCAVIEKAASEKVRGVCECCDVVGSSESHQLKQVAQLLVSDNLDLGCAVIEKAASEKVRGVCECCDVVGSGESHQLKQVAQVLAVRDLEEVLGPALAMRRKQREALGAAYYDASIYSQGSLARIPEALRPKPGRLTLVQQRIYEDFAHLPWQGQVPQAGAAAAAAAAVLGGAGGAGQGGQQMGQGGQGQMVLGQGQGQGPQQVGQQGQQQVGGVVGGGAAGGGMGGMISGLPGSSMSPVPGIPGAASGAASAVAGPPGLAKIPMVAEGPLAYAGSPAPPMDLPGLNQQVDSSALPQSANAPPDHEIKAQAVALFDDWVRVSEAAGSNDKAVVVFLSQLQHSSLLASEDAAERLFRTLTDMVVAHCLASSQPLNPPPPAAPGSGQVPPARGLNFTAVDMFSRLVVLLIKYYVDLGGNANLSKVNLLNKVLSGVVRVIHRQADERRLTNPRPFFRLLANLLIDLNAPDPNFDAATHQVLTTLAATFHALQPLRVPSFSFAWLELISHRSFMPKLLLFPGQKGWPWFQRLLLSLFKFMEPYLRDAELSDPIRLMYKGAIRVLLVLLHDFPEFLCDYHFSFCDIIPPTCIQMRNLVLSAFPRNMRLPDPFTPNLKHTTPRTAPPSHHSPHLHSNAQPGAIRLPAQHASPRPLHTQPQADQQAWCGLSVRLGTLHYILWTGTVTNYPTHCTTIPSFPPPAFKCAPGALRLPP